jgi:hypothetical protein
VKVCVDGKGTEGSAERKGEEVLDGHFSMLLNFGAHVTQKLGQDGLAVFPSMQQVGLSNHELQDRQVKV